MTRVILWTTALLGACSSHVAEGTASEPPEDTAGGDDGQTSGAIDTANSATWTMLATAEKTTSGTDAPYATLSGDMTDTVGTTGAIGGDDTAGTTSDPCDNAAGTHGCPCVNGACIGDLVCGAGNLCYEPNECQGDPGSPWCPCVDGECLSGMDLICVDGTCEVDQCPDVDRMTDPDNCGECGHVCNVGAGIGGCEDGECLPAWGECIDRWPSPAYVDCNDYCTSVGLECAGTIWEEGEEPIWGQCDGKSVYSFQDGGCESFSGGFALNIRCTSSLALPDDTRDYDAQIRCCCK